MQHVKTPRGLVLFLVLFLASLVSFTGTAFAQSCGGSAGPSPCSGGASEGSWLRSGQGSARLSEEYEVKDRSYKRRAEVENDFDETLFVSRTALDVRYGLTDDFTLDLTLTYPHFTYRLKPPGGERRKFRSRGPGDTFLSLGRQFSLLGDESMPAHDARTDDPVGGKFGVGEAILGDAAAEEPPRPLLLSLWAGLSVPTGTTEEPNPAFVTRDVSVANIQTGTGTFDPLLRARIDWPGPNWSVYGELAVRWPLHENRHDYQTGDTEVLVVGADVPIVPRLSAGASLMYQRSARDLFRGEDVGVGGARWVFLVPGVAWQVTDSVSIDLGVRLPIYRRTETKLSDSSAVWQLGLSFRF